jgi:hypothetical protein
MSLVSGGNDNTLKLWDVQTGGVVKTFYGHTSLVMSVSISSDCTTIVSGSGDGTVCLWEVQTAKCHCVIKQDWAHYVVFSPTDSQHFISISGDVIQGWDINGCQVGPTHEGTGVAFSSNGAHIISCRGDVATIRNSDSKVVVAECLVPGDTSEYNLEFVCPCFSHDDRLVAVSSGTTVYVWDITGPGPLLTQIFIGHTQIITSLTFSSPSTLVSASDDKSVKFWQIDGLPTNPVAKGSKFTPPTSFPIKSITLQAEDGIFISCDSDGVVRTWDLSTGLLKAVFQTPAKDDPCRDARMIDGRLIFVWLARRGINIWDTEKGKLLHMVDVDWGAAGGLKLSGDGSKVFLQDSNHLQAWSTLTGEVIGKVEVGDNSCLKSLHVDGSKIWVSFKDRPTQGWNFGVSGSSPISLSETSSERPGLHFIHEHSWWENTTSRVEDRVTGREVFQFPRRYAKPVAAQWDGQYLVAGYRSGEVLILDFCDVHPQ